eukprot:525574-Hanusia_phi.AAC.1
MTRILGGVGGEETYVAGSATNFCCADQEDKRKILPRNSVANLASPNSIFLSSTSATGQKWPHRDNDRFPAISATPLLRAHAKLGSSPSSRGRGRGGWTMGHRSKLRARRAQRRSLPGL